MFEEASIIEYSSDSLASVIGYRPLFLILLKSEILKTTSGGWMIF